MLQKPGFIRGAAWSLLVCLCSCGNDILMRLLGDRLPSMEVSFFRFAFALLILLPLVVGQGRRELKTSRPALHFFRGILGFISVSLWCYAVSQAPLTMVTVMGFTVPLFVLPLARIFLQEKVGRQRVFATLIGFVGILVTVQPQNAAYWLPMLGLVIAAISFASMDVLIKKMVVQESTLSMLFYFSLATSLASLGPALYVWQMPLPYELVLLLLLGASSNLIQYCLFKAFSAADISALAPIRYFEFPIASLLGWLLFAELPNRFTLLGACIIAPSTLYIVYHEIRMMKLKQRG
jgi:S-adenosylmethionine uptake transporter